MRTASAPPEGKGTRLSASLRRLMLATLENTADPLAWSGSAVEIRRALAAAVETLSVVDNLKSKKHPVHAGLRLLLGKHSNQEPRYPLWMTKPALREFARVTAAAIAEHKPQALLSISSQCLIYLHEFYKGPSIPVFSFADSAWMTWLEVYEGFWPRPIGTSRYAAREREAAQRATGLIYASEWAKVDAVRRFDVAAAKVHVQPMGAAWVPQVDEAAIEAAVRARPADQLRLLFVAKEWERKGGPLALEIARGLRAGGQVGEVWLDIVGVRPELAPEDLQFVRMHGLLRRSEPAEAEKLRSLLHGSHLLIVPTRAECFGLVFAEAQAFALPPVARAVHAVPSVILDGTTGILEPADAGPEPYIQRIVALMSGDRSAYLAMALAGRRHFLDRLNWPAFGQGVKRIIESALVG